MALPQYQFYPSTGPDPKPEFERLLPVRTAADREDEENEPQPEAVLTTSEGME